MYHRFKLVVCAFLVSVSVAIAVVDSQPASARSDDGTDFFEKRIRPILITNCAPCHNPQTHVAKLDLTTAEGFATGGESGPLINRAIPEKSRLLEVIGYAESLKMPPKGKLKEDEIAALNEWVKLGAPWAKSAPVQPAANSTPARSTRESSSTASAAVTLSTSRSRPTVAEPMPRGKIGGVRSRSTSCSPAPLVSPPSDTSTIPATGRRR